MIQINHGLPPSKPKPPQLAESLLCLLLSQKDREEVLGSMRAYFYRDVKRYGTEKASRYFWAETLRSLFPFAKRFVEKLAQWSLLGEMLRRLIP